MRLDIICLFPESIAAFFNESILKRAQNKQIVSIHLHNIRDYASPPHQKVDDSPYGGEAGMVMLAEPIARCIDQLREQRTYDEMIYLSPDGVPLKQTHCNQFALKKNIILLCGHYKGIDQRIRDVYITQEISIGDYVLTGGEIAAAVLTDAIVRVIPGVLNDASSALTDSFQNHLGEGQPVLSAPVYTRPANWRGHQVPEILLSGHAQKIADWQEEQALAKTRERRPDLLDLSDDKLNDI